ncbi:MarR family winged helix-turn-helix transcriptional regulator [Sciscionella sediminilitoris]|uniref:MarR family winged helix-turn-helix transcriptional regulator n=1 Tax=Sciscionella sediminilitoris TaxID=1445613 RepID=UPI0004DEFC1F|nr:MarR family transcriptional regulator [Sciscionella sp. SE31]
MSDRTTAVDQLAKAAYRLSAADSRLRGRATREPGALSLAHARALKSLAEHGPMTVGKLAAQVETTGAAVTQLVTGLVTAGFVTRERPRSGDRRTTTVALTEAGLARHREREQVVTAGLTELLHELDADSIATAANVLDQLAVLYDRL